MLRKDPAIVEDFIGDTLQYGNKGTVKRIGYLLAQLGIATDRLFEMKQKLGHAKSLIPWIAGHAAKGSINKEWGLIVNGSIPNKPA
jgi:predicted transcriptional regulator of viral defense system